MFDDNMAAMRLSGFDDELRAEWTTIDANGELISADPESPVDYLCAQYLI